MKSPQMESGNLQVGDNEQAVVAHMDDIPRGRKTILHEVVGDGPRDGYSVDSGSKTDFDWCTINLGVNTP